MSDPLSRYHRQAILADFGVEAQARLARSHAMIVGCGALGCPAADLLCRAGVGRISIVDRDVVELTNLQRQTLFDERDAAEALPKAEAAARRLRGVNSSIVIHALVEDFAGVEAERMVVPHPRPDVILDCTDNFETRYLINDLAVKHEIPYVYGGAVGTTGMNMTVRPGVTPCLRCVFPEPPPPGSAPSCDTAGILGPVAAMVGAQQAIDAIKLLTGRVERLSGKLGSFDGWRNTRRELDVGASRRTDCPCCGERRFEFLEAEVVAGPRVLCGRNSVQVGPARAAVIDLEVLAQRLAPAGVFTRTAFHLRGSITGDAGAHDLTVFADGRAIIGGTTDPVLARSLYARYVGA